MPDLDVIVFCRDPRLLDFQLWPAQEMILRAAWGLPMPPELLPLWHEGVEDDRLAYLPRRYSYVVLVMGRRSGKTRMMRADTAYSALVGDPAAEAPPAEYVTCAVVATSQSQARNVFLSTLHRELKHSEALSAEIVEDQNTARGGEEWTTKDQIVFRNRSIIQALPCNSKAGLGYEAWRVVYDEASSYSQEMGSPRGDEQIMAALNPSLSNALLAGRGRVDMISTPGAKSGEFWRAYDEREKRREWQLTIRFPSWRLNPRWNDEIMRIERERDPLAFSMHYGAEFCEGISSVLVAEVIAAILFDRPSLPPAGGRVYWGRIDPAFVRDRFGIGVAHAEGDWCRVDHLEAVSPPRAGAVDLADVLARIRALHVRYGVRRWTTDQYAGEPIAQQLRAAGVPVEVVPWTAGYKRTIYSTFVAKANARRLDLPRSEILYRELSRLQQRTGSAGQISIGHPAGDGETDDLADVCAGLSHDCATQSSAPRRAWEVRPL